MAVLSKKNKIWIFLAAISLIAAIGIHTNLTVRHYKITHGLTVGESICNIDQTFRCDDVNTSAYSQVFDIPIALAGVVTNLGLLVLLLLATFSTGYRPRIFSHVFYLSLLVGLASVIMGVISITALNQYCIFCILVYVLSFVTIIGIWQGFGPPRLGQFMEDLRALMGGARIVLIILILIPVGTVLAGSVMSNHYEAMRAEKMRLQKLLAESRPIAFEPLQLWKQAPAFPFQLNGALFYQKYNPDAKMTIVEYIDFLCPHCRRASKSIKQFVADKGDINWALLHFPLDGACNSRIQRKTNISCPLAKTVICTRDHKQAWEIHEAIFARQDKIRSVKDTTAVIKDLAKTYGLKHSQLQACIEAPETQALLETQLQQAYQNNVRGTPTIFVNGRRLLKGQSVPVLEAVYEDLGN